MNRLKRFLFVPLVCLMNSVMAQTIAPEGTWIAPSDSNIQYIGRISFQNPDAPVFTYPGTQINARFEGTSLRMKLGASPTACLSRAATARCGRI